MRPETVNKHIGPIISGLMIELQAGQARKVSIRRIINTFAERHPELYRKHAHRIDQKQVPSLHHLSAEGKALGELRHSAWVDWTRDARVCLYGRPVCVVCNSQSGPKFDAVESLSWWGEYCSPECAEKRRISSRLDEIYSWSKAKRKRTFCTDAALAHTATVEGRRKWIESCRRGALNQSPETKRRALEKRQSTSLYHWGVSNPMQSESVRRRAQRFRTYSIRLSGVKFEGLQGYEGKALEFMVKNLGVNPRNIRTKDLTNFRYKDRISGKERVYFPDAEVSGRFGTSVVEVKSVFSAGITKSQMNHEQNSVFEMLYAKSRAVTKAGFRFVLMIGAGEGRWLMHVGPVPSAKKLRQFYDQVK